MTGAHPKVVQTVMRHQSITLTMDTYGHRFPGQEADAVGRMRELLIAPPEALRATGTDNATADTPNGAQRQAQRAKPDKVVRWDAMKRSARPGKNAQPTTS